MAVGRAADYSWMKLSLPEPPDSFPPAPRAFYDELRQMLAVVDAPKLSGEKTSVRFDKNGLDVDLVHLSRDDLGIWATVGERDAIVGTSYAHEHFFAPAERAAGGRPWTTEIVDFIAEILRGEVEVETKFRGDTPISVEHFNFDETGQRNSLGHTGFLVPGRLMFWRSKRTETQRLSFR
jgi:hypothetical protein